MPSFKSVVDEIGYLSLIISIPQFISAPISLIIFNLLNPIPMPWDIVEILDFLVISFPLTLAIALITYLVRHDENSFVLFVGMLVGAALLSNFLHNALSAAFPSVDVASAYREAFTRPDDLPGSRGSGYLVNFAIKIISLYWEKFGVILFIQSCVIGIYAGMKYFKKEEAKPE
ncbi:MAG TPA: hypothetical protein VGK46_04185 [Saprospiraceae bacterium]